MKGPDTVFLSALPCRVKIAAHTDLSESSSLDGLVKKLCRTPKSFSYMLPVACGWSVV